MALHAMQISIMNVGCLWDEVIRVCGRKRTDIWVHAEELDNLALGCPDILPFLRYDTGHLRMDVLFSAIDREKDGSIRIFETLECLRATHNALIRRRLLLRDAFRIEPFPVSYRYALALAGAKFYPCETSAHPRASKHLAPLAEHAPLR